MKLFRMLLPFCCCFLYITLYANDEPIKNLGIENGLSNNAVMNVYQDYKGFMWICTYDGLNRFDGYKFRIFRNKIGDTTSLNDNGNFTIEGDYLHRVWLGGRKGISVFNPVNEQFNTARFTPYKSATPRPEIGVIHIIRAGDSGKTVLAGTERDGLLLFHENVYAGIQIPIIQSANTITNYEVTGIDFDHNMAFVFVQDLGLCRYNTQTKSLTVINQSIRQANCLRSDQKGGLWLGTDNGLFRYDLTDNSYSENYIQTHNKVVGLCMDKNGRIWVASDGAGVFIVSSRDNINKCQLNSNAVYAVYEDREGRMWIGTLRGGISIIAARRNPFELRRFNGENAVCNFILSFCEGDNNDIWIGTDGGGLKHWDRQRNQFTAFTADATRPNAISSNFITCILRDVQDDIWVSTWFGGINRYKKGSHAFEHFQCNNPITQATENNVWVVYEDTQKQIWASTTNNGTLYTFNRTTNQFELFDNSLVNIQCLAEDAKGHLWGGNYQDLISIDRVHKQHKVFHIGYTVRSIHEDKKGNFWVGTDGGGLLQFNQQTGRFIRYTATDGLPSNAILRILEDNSGDLWLSTFNGLARFDPQTKICRSFSQSDGLQSNQFSYNAALKLSTGECMFGGIKGFNIFFPDSIYAQNTLPPVFLTGIRINNTPVEQEGRYISKSALENVEELRVPYDKAAISMDFVALEYTSPDKINYAYRLEGWDKQWNYVGESRTATYTRLQEGTYTFKIKATNAEGRWGNEISTIRIIVLPPWYRSWWAYLLYTLAIGGILYIFMRYRSRQERLHYEIRLAHLENEKEKELNEKKLSFFTHISHEFRTPLSLIINPLKAYTQDPELSIVYRNARRLLSLVDQLLLFRKADSGGDVLKINRLDLVELCKEAFLCFSQQARLKNIDYQFEGGQCPIEMYVDDEKMEVALFNLLSNAFKFTPDGGKVVFKIRELFTEVEISIQDTGCGIPISTGNRIFDKFSRVGGRQTGFGIGLYLVKHFIESHGGGITYHSRQEEGTTFVIRLRKGLGHLKGYDFATSERSAILQELMEETSVPVKKEEKVQPEEMVTEKKSLLCIDDNADIRAYLRQLFSDHYIIYEAENGDDGFAMVQEHLPDLVISDVQMPGMDGLELCTKIKTTEALSHIPVILLTSAHGLKIKGIEEGADDYITKPFDKDLLLAKVQTLLKNRNLLRQYFLDSITLQKSTVKVPAAYRDFLNNCISIVEANLGNEDFSIKTFTQAIGMSHSSLYKKVKSISGQTINAFIRSIRLRKAAMLLLKEEYTINQAAFEVGIGDVKYFREQFVKLFGMNPSEYVKRYRHSFNQDLTVVKEGLN